MSVAEVDEHPSGRFARSRTPAVVTNTVKAEFGRRRRAGTGRDRQSDHRRAEEAR